MCIVGCVHLFSVQRRNCHSGTRHNSAINTAIHSNKKCQSVSVALSVTISKYLVVLIGEAKYTATVRRNKGFHLTGCVVSNDVIVLWRTFGVFALVIRYRLRIADFVNLYSTALLIDPS